MSYLRLRLKQLKYNFTQFLYNFYHNLPELLNKRNKSTYKIEGWEFRDKGDNN